MEKAAPEQRFLNIGLDQTVVKNTLANPKVTANLLEVLDFAKVDKCDKKIGTDLLTRLKCLLALI